MKPTIKKILPKEVPEDYRLRPDGWLFPAEKAEGKLLTLDISLAPDAFVQAVNQADEKAKAVDDNYGTICPHNCKGCFEKGGIENDLLSFKDLQDLIEQAKELGLESVKFLGPGELFTNPDLFKILDYFQENDIKITIFTKGGILGDDELAQRYQGMSSKDLVERVCDYDISRISVNCTTFDEEKTNKISRSESNNYARARKRALELLAEQGMNQDLYNQRLSITSTPVTDYTIGDIFDLYKWGAERNIPVIIAPSMVSGKGRGLIKKAQDSEFQQRLIELYTEINGWAVERGITDLEQLEEEGISAYAGTTPCNQLGYGMFIRKDGVVQACPGNDSEEFRIAQDVRDKPLNEIWDLNPRKGSHVNNKCVKDGVTIPKELYDQVLEKVYNKLG